MTMTTPRERNQSYWMASTPETAYPQLQGETFADIAVIGGGLTGLLTSIMLRRSGASVSLIEAGRIAASTTGYTTAKITSLHTLIYSSLIDKFGEERAGLYAEVNEQA